MHASWNTSASPLSKEARNALTVHSVVKLETPGFLKSGGSLFHTPLCPQLFWKTLMLHLLIQPPREQKFPRHSMGALLLTLIVRLISVHVSFVHRMSSGKFHNPQKSILSSHKIHAMCSIDDKNDIWSLALVCVCVCCAVFYSFWLFLGGAPPGSQINHTQRLSLTY